MSKKAKDDGGFPLPDIIDPPRICIQIEVPNEPAHLRAFWGCLLDLTRWFNWEFDDEHTAKKVADVWLDVWLKANDHYLDRECMTDPCCPETNDLLSQILALLKGGATINFNAVTKPPDFVVDCTPENFDGQPDQSPIEGMQWYKALCLALTQWVDAVIYVQAANMNKASLAPQILALAGLTTPPSFTSQLDFVNFPFSVQNLQEILDSPDGFKTAVCAIRDALNGKTNSFETFKAALSVVMSALTDPTIDADGQTAIVARWYGGDSVNYTLFAKALEKAHESVIAGTDESCICDDEVCDPANFDIIADNDCTVERIDATHWHITQLNHIPYLSDKRQFIIQIRDRAWRCFNVYTQTMAVSGYQIYNCDGVFGSGVGGAGGAGTVWFMEVKLEYNDDPEIVGFDSIFQIICP